MKLHPMNMNVSLISTHRQFLYGFAALWILFFHFCTRIPQTGIFTLLSHIQQAGSCGVEIFLLLTGMGLYQSMKRTPSVGEFYRKRFLRVFLPALIVMAVYNTLVDNTFADYLASVTFFGYWFGADVIWYVPFILTMYLIYPLLFKIQTRKSWMLYLVLALSVVLSFAAETMDVEPNILRGISRIPIFVFGCALAPYFDQKKQIPRYVFPIAFGATVLMTLCWYGTQAESRFYFTYYYFYRSFLYAGFAIVLIMVLSVLAQWFSERKCFHVLYRFLAFFGMISLEVYLLYERVWMTLESFPGFVSDPFSFLKLDIAAIILTVILSVLLQRITTMLITAYDSVKIPG